MDFDAIVLAGGSARRLNGADKGAVQLEHVPLLRRALDIVEAASTTIVVGPATNAVTAGVDRARQVRFITEDPPRGGPAAAISAGLAEVDHEVVVVLACDMPFVGPATITRLLSSLDDQTAGALLVDENGRRQYLAAAYRTDRLRDALGTLEPIHNAPVHKAITLLTVVEIAADPDEAFDIDTWQDVERSRRLLEER